LGRSLHSLAQSNREDRIDWLLPMRKSGNRMSPDPTILVAPIIATLRLRYKFLNLRFEAGWTESWSHCRCLHEHLTLIEAAKYAMPHGAGWYVFAVEGDAPRQLTDAEDRIVNEFRFGGSRPLA
jgi:hypothetical protein